MKQQQQPIETLLTISQQQQQFPQQSTINTKMSKILMIVFSVLFVLGFVVMAIIFFYGPQPTGTKPELISILWAKDREIVMEMGTTRVFQVLFFSDNNNRVSENFVLVRERAINWTVQPQGIVTVDLYGRVEPMKIGTCVLKVQSLDRAGIYDTRTIRVVEKRNDTVSVPKRVIDFKGAPAPLYTNLQKLIQRTPKQQVQNSTNIPDPIKQASANPNKTYQSTVNQGDVIWSIKKYADGSPKNYLLRTNNSMPDSNRDKYQYFVGDRYLPDVKVIMITDDLMNGVWVVGFNGDVNHIIMKTMTYREKALYMIQQTRKYVERYGIVASATYRGGEWVPDISDNDGLWTSLYGTGELMRYAVAKRYKLPDEQIQAARASGIRALKAVLMISNIAGRNATVQAKIRHLNNTACGQGAIYQKQYLKKDKQMQVEVYPGKPSDTIGVFGVDAGKTIDGDKYPGTCKYTFGPINPEDWTLTEQPALTKRKLNSYVSRTFYLPKFEEKPGGGVWFQRNPNGSQTVIGGANTLYEYQSGDTPILDIGDLDVPEVLLDILNINGTQYNKYDVVYKGDTSTDQIIGHLFIYKAAYDILSDEDPEEKKLRELIRSTLRGFCQHLVDNGHQMVDATGQATKWAKLYRQLFTSDYDIEDGPLKIIQLLLSLKMAYYVTGELKWKQEYDMLTDYHGQFDYLTAIEGVWDRLVFAHSKLDHSSQGLYRLDFGKNLTDIQIQRHTIYHLHFSDDQQAYLAYYLACQLEQDQTKFKSYLKGMQAYWHSISQTENPFYYYIYQLGYPHEPKSDKFQQNLLKTASWQLNRHVIDTRKYQAFVMGSRPDVIMEKYITVNPDKIVQSPRSSQTDKQYVDSQINRKVCANFSANNIYQIKVLPADERCIRKFNSANFDKPDSDHSEFSMEGSTTYTLPYWFGIYHGMLALQ